MRTSTKIDISRLRQELDTLPVQQQVLLQTDGVVTEPGSYPENEQDFIIPIYDLEYMNELMEQFGMARTRLMRMAPRSCYSWHYDLTPRIHIPIITQPGSCMIVEDEVIRFEEGVVQWVDTRKYHTAVNPGLEERVHVVGVLRDWT